MSPASLTSPAPHAPSVLGASLCGFWTGILASAVVRPLVAQVPGLVALAFAGAVATGAVVAWRLHRCRAPIAAFSVAWALGVVGVGVFGG